MKWIRIKMIVLELSLVIIFADTFKRFRIEVSLRHFPSNCTKNQLKGSFRIHPKYRVRHVPATWPSWWLSHVRVYAHLAAFKRSKVFHENNCPTFVVLGMKKEKKYVARKDNNNKIIIGSFARKSRANSSSLGNTRKR